MAEKEGGIVKKGHEEGIKMLVSLLKEFEIPEGLFPLVDIIEVGFVRATGYVWIVQKKQLVHEFKKIGKQASYDTEITGYISKKKMTKLKGVKAKGLMLWAPANEFTVDGGKVHSKTFAGISQAFPVEAFAAGQ